MANLAPLAIKLVANMEKAQKDFTTMSSTIASIEKSTKNATPSMKNLTDAVKGMNIMQDAVAKAQEAYNNEPMIETQRIVEQTTASLSMMKSTVENLGQGVSDDILHMKPTISNVQKAQAEVQKLKALHADLEKQGQGHLLADSIKQAEANMAELGSRTVQLNAEMQMFKTTLMGINAAPFMVLSVLVSDLLSGMRGIGKEFNEKFGGMPGRIFQVTVAFGALVTVIGLASAKMTALGISTSYFMGLWKSSVIYQGLAGVITLLNSILGTQIAITAATVAWVAVVTLGIGAVIALVSVMAMRWFDNSAAIKDSTESMKGLENQTQKTVDRWRELNNVAKNALESLMTPAEKLVKKLKEIDSFKVAEKEIRESLKRIGKEQELLAAQMADRKNQGWFDDTNRMKRMEARFIENEKDFANLNESLKALQNITDEQKNAMKLNAALEYRKERYGNLLDETMSAQEHYTETLRRLDEDMKKPWVETRMATVHAEFIKKNLDKQLRNTLGMDDSSEKLQERMALLAFAFDKKIISEKEYYAAIDDAKQKWDPATKAAIELTKETKRLADRFREMGKTPVESFKELSVDLTKVRDALSPAQFVAAKTKLLADLANGLGVAAYLAEVASPAQKLAETYKNLEIYAREAGLSAKELAAAPDRARAALEKQSEYYNLYQKAQDAMLTTQQKLNRELGRIADEAKQWGWDKAIVEKMKDLKTEELLGKLVDSVAEKIDLGASEKSVDQSRNAAVEAGTMAYYEAQMKSNKPMLDETKKHTKHLANIDKAVNRKEDTKQQNFIVIG